ncbi:unnamed protein product [Trichogramma brassicae]|uniref:Uncharacterized protein n=1 Tax=Trichogramma brassicae TaxID=86971 RepID=A0A6H5J0U6_9HYME|nr:unnamed protein product [Trichogramma brassicae]
MSQHPHESLFAKSSDFETQESETNQSFAENDGSNDDHANYQQTTAESQNYNDYFLPSSLNNQQVIAASDEEHLGLMNTRHERARPRVVRYRDVEIANIVLERALPTICVGTSKSLKNRRCWELANSIAFVLVMFNLSSF